MVALNLMAAASAINMTRQATPSATETFWYVAFLSFESGGGGKDNNHLYHMFVYFHDHFYRSDIYN